MGGKSSKRVTVGYWYEIAFHSGLGIGPIDAYLEFRGGDMTAWTGEATHSQTIHINAPKLWGGEKDQGGIVGDVDLMFGEQEQQPNSRLTAIFGTQQPAWRGLATLAFAGRYGAMSPYPQPASHKIRKIKQGWDGECWYPGKAAIPMPTCNGDDPYIHATSLPYPQYLSDGATAVLAPTGGQLKAMVLHATLAPDGATASLAPTGGSLASILKLSTLAPDGATASLAPTSGSLKAVLKLSTLASDGATASLAPTSGRLVLVPEATLASDGATASLAPTSGSLTIP